jgi:hypothetical protein
MGWRQPRINGDEYYDFVDQVINWNSPSLAKSLDSV